MKYPFIGILISRYLPNLPVVQFPKRLMQIAGYTDEDLSQQFQNNYLPFITPEDSPRVQMDLEKQLNLGDTFILEYGVCAKNGESIHLTEMGNRIYGENGEEFLCSGIVLTPTSLSLEEYYRNILDCLPTPVFITDSRMTVSFLNQAAQKCLGRTLEECQGQSWNTLDMPLEGTPDFLTERFRASGTATTFIGSDGQTYEAVFSTLKEPNGKNTGYICVFTDITLLQQTEHKLRLTEEDYRLALSQSNTSIWEYDVASNTVYQTENQASRASSIYNVTPMFPNVPESLLEAGIIQAENVEPLREMYSKIQRGEKSAECILKIYSKEGQHHWIEANCTTIFDSQGIPLRAIGVSKDITDQKTLEEQYQQECRYRNTMATDALSTYEVDLTENIPNSFDSDWFSMLSLPDDITYTALLNEVIKKAVHPRHCKEVQRVLGRDNLLQAYHNGMKDIKCDYQRLDSSGNMVWVRSTAYLTQSPVSKHIFAVIYIKNIDEQKKHELELLQKAERDPLTGLYNRNASLHRIDQALKKATDNEEVCVMFMVDIDNFKQVNDTYGHLYGDAVLCEMSKRLLGIFRREDVVGRVGGDEFIVFLSNIPSQSTALDKAAQICRGMRNIYSTGGRQCEISGSVGMAFSPFHGNSFDELYEKADIALYHSKSEGKNQFSVYREGLTKINLNLKKTTDVERRLGKTFVDNITEYIFKILFHSDNLDVSIPSVLQLLSNHLEGHHAYIIDYSSQNLTVSMAYEWCGPEAHPLSKVMQDRPIYNVEDILQIFDEDGSCCIPCHTPLPDLIQEILDKGDAKSALLCAIVASGEFQGFLGIDICDASPRTFSLEEKETIKSATEMIGTFLKASRRDAERQHYIAALQTVLGNLDSASYVINPANHQLVYLNEKTQSLFRQAKLGDLCYKRLRGNNRICDDCPIYLLTEDTSKQASTEIYDPHMKVWLHITASWVQWPDGGHYCLLNCTDISKYKK